MTQENDARCEVSACEKCGEVLEGRMTANSIGHTQECRDRLAARLAKEGASHQETADIMRRIRDDRDAIRAELETTKARLAEAIEVARAANDNCDALRAELAECRAELEQVRRDACVIEHNDDAALAIQRDIAKEQLMAAEARAERLRKAVERARAQEVLGDDGKRVMLIVCPKDRRPLPDDDAERAADSFWSWHSAMSGEKEAVADLAALLRTRDAQAREAGWNEAVEACALHVFDSALRIAPEFRRVVQIIGDQLRALKRPDRAKGG